MIAKKVFELSKGLDEIRYRYLQELDKIEAQSSNLKESCDHAVVIKYMDNHPRLAQVDGNYFCPACKKMIRVLDKEKFKETAFANSKVVDTTSLSLIGSRETLDAFANEVLDNIDLYYHPLIDAEELTNFMIESIKAKQLVYDAKELKRQL